MADCRFRLSSSVVCSSSPVCRLCRSSSSAMVRCTLLSPAKSAYLRALWLCVCVRVCVGVRVRVRVRVSVGVRAAATTTAVQTPSGCLATHTTFATKDVCNVSQGLLLGCRLNRFHSAVNYAGHHENVVLQIVRLANSTPTRSARAQVHAYGYTADCGRQRRLMCRLRPTLVHARRFVRTCKTASPVQGESHSYPRTGRVHARTHARTTRTHAPVALSRGSTARTT
jgi:hypothetical protein